MTATISGSAIGVATITRTALHVALERTTSVIGRGSKASPILGCVRIQADDRGLQFAATDFDRSVTTTVAADGALDFPTRVVPGLRLLAVVSQLPPGAVTLTATPKGVRVSCGSARFDIAGFSADDFPDIVSFKGVTSATDGPTLLTALSRVAPFCSSEVSRPTFGGVHVAAAVDADILVEATDGYRLTRVTVPRASGAALNVIVPHPTVATMAKLFAEAADFAFGVNETQLSASGSIGADRVSLRSRLIEGPFPDTSMFFKRTLKHHATADGVALLAAVKRVASLSSAEAAVIRLEWSADSVRLQLTGDEDAGSAEDVVPCTADVTAPIDISFTPYILADALALHPSDLRLAFEDAKTLLTISDEGAPLPHTLIMPRVNHARNKKP